LPRGTFRATQLDLRLNRLVRNFAAVWCHQISDAGDRVSGAQSKL
jgi:hypothetical protein